MPGEARSPWPLLLSRLRLGSRVAVSRAELEQAGLDADHLLDLQVLERAAGRPWRPPECEHLCEPNLDWQTRRAEGLVGVACPHEPACWPGFRWFPTPEVEVFSCRADRVFSGLRERNGLEPLDLPPGTPAVPVGIYARRGKRFPVVWMPARPPGFEDLCRGLAYRLAGDGLVVLVSRLVPGEAGRACESAAVVLDLADAPDGDLRLWRVLDLVDPDYRRRRLEDGGALFDDVHIELATEPGVRHVLRINGIEHGGFQRSDVKFTRLLYLAAQRAADPDVEGGGWLKKTRLQDDDKNHETEAVRDELCRPDHPDLSAEELRVLVTTSPRRDGTVRLAVHPRSIRFDGSLARFQFVGEQQTEPRSKKRFKTPGARQLAQNLQAGREAAEQFLAAARTLGVPGPASPGG